MRLIDTIATRLRRPDTCATVPTTDTPNGDSKPQKGGAASILITAAIILAGMIIVAVFREDINRYGVGLMESYGRDKVDIILLLLTALSCSPICLPVWQYVLVGVAMGYGVVHLAVTMAIGAALGSLITYYIGRCFGQTRWVARRFHRAADHPWIRGRSKWYVTAIMFLGTASPIPFDVLYFACGIKKYPALLLFVTCAAARFVRYVYLGYGFDFFTSWM